MLSANDVSKLCYSTAVSKRHAKGHVTRLIIDIAFMIATCPRELYGHCKMDGSYHECEREPVIGIVNTTGDLDGKSRTMKGGLRSVRDKPLEFFIF